MTFEIHEVVAQRFALLALGRVGEGSGAEKTRSQKMLVNRAESPASSARFVRRFKLHKTP